MKGNLRFKINWASLTVGSKFTVFALFYFSEGNFPCSSPRGAYNWRGDLTDGFLRYRFRGLIFGGGLYIEGLILEILRNFKGKCPASRTQTQTPASEVVLKGKRKTSTAPITIYMREVPCSNNIDY